jgi:hypothetical protein
MNEDELLAQALVCCRRRQQALAGCVMLRKHAVERWAPHTPPPKCALCAVLACSRVTRSPAQWAAEQADLYGAAYGSEAADSDSDYDCGGGGSSSRKRRKQASASRSRTKAPRSKSGAARAVYEGPHTAPAAQPAAPDPGTSSDVQQPAAGDSAAAPAAAAAQPEEGGAAAVAAADGSGAEGGRRKRKDCGQKREKGRVRRSWDGAAGACVRCASCMRF